MITFYQDRGRTSIGRVAKTFDFCGFRFAPEGVVALAKATEKKFTSTIRKLYEQGRDAEVKVKNYKSHFKAWITGILRPFLRTNNTGNSELPRALLTY